MFLHLVALTREKYSADETIFAKITNICKTISLTEIRTKHLYFNALHSFVSVKYKLIYLKILKITPLIYRFLKYGWNMLFHLKKASYGKIWHMILSDFERIYNFHHFSNIFWRTNKNHYNQRVKFHKRLSICQKKNKNITIIVINIYYDLINRFSYRLFVLDQTIKFF